MPVAFRVADGVRAARLAKIERCKVTGSLDDDDGYGDEEYGDATGAEAGAAAGRAEAAASRRSGGSRVGDASVVVVAGPPPAPRAEADGPQPRRPQTPAQAEERGRVRGLENDDGG